jgi:hypothetical protein
VWLPCCQSFKAAAAQPADFLQWWSCRPDDAVLQITLMPRTSYSLTTFGWSSFFKIAISLLTSVASSALATDAAAEAAAAAGVAAVELVVPMPLLALIDLRVPFRKPPARGRCRVLNKQLRFIICASRREGQTAQQQSAFGVRSTIERLLLSGQGMLTLQISIPAEEPTTVT